MQRRIKNTRHDNPNQQKTPMQNTTLKPLGFAGSVVIFGIASAILTFETHYLIPLFSRITGWETVVFWFIFAGLGMFLPLLIASYIFIRREGLTCSRETWKQRLRFRRLTGHDILWSIGGIVGIGILSASIMEILKAVFGAMHSQPPFMAFEPLSAGRYWILAVWFPYWLLNIMGEEIFWRGVLLPRQELAFGKNTWIVHGFCWSIFHLCFGWQLFLTMLPILFVQSYVVCRTKNSWTGVIIHAVINGPSFILIALGVI